MEGSGHMSRVESGTRNEGISLQCERGYLPVMDPDPSLSNVEKASLNSSISASLSLGRSAGLAADMATKTDSNDPS